MMGKSLVRDGLAKVVSKLPVGILTDARFFRMYEESGWHVTPVHFYFPIPDTRQLKDDLWDDASELVGIDMREAEQRELIQGFQRDFFDDYRNLVTELPNLESFGAVDAEVLYCMIRRFRPRRIIEVGSGGSTRIMSRAIQDNQARHGHECHLTTIDPYPDDELKQGVPGLAELWDVPVQDIALADFSTLRKDDFLFIDSSHVCKIGSDVNYLFLEVIPRVASGVMVHVHDVFMPAEYRKQWVMERRVFWTEQYLLQAFLSFNDSFAVRWGSSYMHLRQPSLLDSCVPSYQVERNWPSSFWMQRVRDTGTVSDEGD